MKDSSTFLTTGNLSILVVGEPKSGHTSLGMAFPGLGVLDLDFNLASAVRRFGAVRPKFKYSQPALLDDGKPRPIGERWVQCVTETKAMIADPDVKTILCDGLGNLSQYLIDHILKSAVDSGTASPKTKAPAFDTTDVSKRVAQMEIQHYGDFARLLRMYVMMIRSSGKYFVMTSHQTGDKDEVTSAIRYVLAIPGQLKDTLGGLFTDVWATSVTPFGLGKHRYEIRTKPTGFHVALGASFPLDAAIDVTDLTPQAIWGILEPKITANAK
jgi:hypothetical protein